MRDGPCITPRAADATASTEGRRHCPMNASRYNIPFSLIFAVVFVLFIYLLLPFWLPLFWAAVFASIFSPLYSLIRKKIGAPGISAFLVLVIIALIIILPAGLIGRMLIAESTDIYASLGKGGSDIAGEVRKLMDAVRHVPLLDRLPFQEDFWTEKIFQVAKDTSNYIFSHLTGLTQDTVVFLAKFAVMFYALFFFLRDGEAVLKGVIDFFPLGRERGEMLYERFKATARASLKVTLIIGGLQGVLGGMIFLATGIQGALIWGVIMVPLSIVPGVGCSIVWVPAGVIMLLTGHPWKGALILAFGFLVISMIDNLLRPILLGKDIQMSSLLIFLSILGGITLFGFSGFVVGPMITSLFLAMGDMYRRLQAHRNEE